jgi:hypothetical protein
MIKIIRQTLLGSVLGYCCQFLLKNIRQTLLRVSLESLLPVPDQKYPPDFAAGQFKVSVASS